MMQADVRAPDMNPLDFGSMLRLRNAVKHLLTCLGDTPATFWAHQPNWETQSKVSDGEHLARLLAFYWAFDVRRHYCADQPVFADWTTARIDACALALAQFGGQRSAQLVRLYLHTRTRALPEVSRQWRLRRIEGRILDSAPDHEKVHDSALQAACCNPLEWLIVRTLLDRGDELPGLPDLLALTGIRSQAGCWLGRARHETDWRELSQSFVREAEVWLLGNNSLQRVPGKSLPARREFGTDCFVGVARSGCEPPHPPEASDVVQQAMLFLS